MLVDGHDVVSYMSLHLGMHDNTSLVTYSLISSLLSDMVLRSCLAIKKISYNAKDLQITQKPCHFLYVGPLALQHRALFLSASSFKHADISKTTLCTLHCSSQNWMVKEYTLVVFIEEHCSCCHSVQRIHACCS
eukprot:jgi/Antlo1/2485/2582